MAIPHRGSTGFDTYFITANCWEKMFLLKNERSAKLLIEVLYHYRAENHYLLHEFTVMPNHFHLLITPLKPTTLELCLQLIKGGYSFRRRKEGAYRGEIWQTSFVDRRVRDSEEYTQFREYIHQNPVAARLCESVENWPFGSACSKFELDQVPQRLKPIARAADMQA